MAEYTQATDDEFLAFARRAQQEAEEAAKKKSGGGFSRSYDILQWVGLEENVPKIIRFVGRPPESLVSSKGGPTDAHELFLASVLDDDGNRCELRLPLHEDDANHDHIMHRIIRAVKAVDWVTDPADPNGKKIKKYKNEGYEWFDNVVHGGYDPINDSINYKQSKGWSGQQVCIMNVIDREDDWCKTNKHTKLLSKKINVSKDGNNTYPFKGVPSYGFVSLLSTMVSGNGSWEKYDVALCRTSVMQSPIRLWDTPASALKKAGILPNDLKSKEQFISIEDHLTDDELNYERYDISHYFAPTTYQKILKCFGKTIKAIDADLNKNFYDELQNLVEKEKAEFEEKYGNDSTANNSTANATATPLPTPPAPESIDPMAAPIPTPTPQPMTEAVSTPAPTTEAAPTRTIVRPTATPATVLSPEKIALLKGWNNLSDQEKSQIVDVLVVDGEIKDIIYAETAQSTVLCPKNDGGCGMPAPVDFRYCPCCGASFM